MATAKSFDDALGETEIANRLRSLWLDQRSVLEDAGYNGESWRRAAHEVWWAQPHRLRIPPDEKSLAEVLGVSDKTLRNWRQRNPERYISGQEAVKRLINEWLPNVAYAAYDNAVNGGKDGATDRKLLFAAGGITTNNTDLTSGGAPMMTYTVLANPDMWDDPTDEPANPAPVGASAVADSTLAG